MIHNELVTSTSTITITPRDHGAISDHQVDIYTTATSGTVNVAAVLRNGRTVTIGDVDVSDSTRLWLLFRGNVESIVCTPSLSSTEFTVDYQQFEVRG